ncbi:carbohydrate kinase family protein [Streptomyces sp. NPDC005407]|uniref:carbohydrate kinase family protein n=1 Tax=Streptomyces sp. NPDC005407 TaxID=3155340 RepID=UPI0033B0286D
MHLVVTGSVATDHVMTFPGRFSEQLLPDQLHSVSLSFLVDSLQVRHSGTAGNIAVGLGRLGVTPRLVAAVGADFEDYAVWLERNGVDIKGIHVEPDSCTARSLLTTDVDQNQIASFYPGAMTRARDIDLNRLLDVSEPGGLVVITRDDPQAMLRHTRACRDRGTAFAAVPSQQLAQLNRGSIEDLVCGADFLFTNRHERALLLRRSGWSEQTVLERVGVWVTTLGTAGARVDSLDAPPLGMPAVSVAQVADPTGAGDAFRAGFLAAIAWGLDHSAAAQLGCAMAAGALESTGAQDYRADARTLLDRLDLTYGRSAAARVAPFLPGTDTAYGPEPGLTDEASRHPGDFREFL